MRVLITGATGFLGSALAYRLLVSGAERVVSYARSESRQAALASWLAPFDKNGALRCFIGDVRDADRLEQAAWSCEAIIHAAALKRVDNNPIETRRTNVDGSANVTFAAARAGVKRVLMISSDKAVSPSTSYGATKAAMEHEAIASNAVYGPQGLAISCVRYGNVLGSTGSVLELWERAAEFGDPLPITDPEATRFWMGLSDALAIVLRSIDRMQGGEVFLPALRALSMGELAAALFPGHPTRVVGMRPGASEKRHEWLLNPEEIVRTVFLPDGDLLIKPGRHPWRADEPAAWTGLPVPADFQYSSDRVPRLTAAQITRMLPDHR